MQGSLNIAILEPYYGGSHAVFVDTICAHSRHRCTPATLPARKWKWRMRGAAAWFTREETAWQGGGGGAQLDLILCNDMLSAADLRSMLPDGLRNMPLVCYFHENQLTYPIPDDQQRDYQYGMTNITSCLAADAVWFNSAFHRDDFLSAAAKLLAKMPDAVPRNIVEEIRERSDVLHPPVDTSGIPEHSETRENERLTILWPHRWEYDKNPVPFFDALVRLDRAGCAFDLVLVGEQFRTAPGAFASAASDLAPHIIHTGYLPSRSAYLATLARCDVVVSTAIQENFGVSVAEAILAGCQPLLPHRLAYPELIPSEWHDSCLYSGDEALFDRLRNLIEGRGRFDESTQSELQTSLAKRCGRETAVPTFDAALAELVAKKRC